MLEGPLGAPGEPALKGAGTVQPWVGNEDRPWEEAGSLHSGQHGGRGTLVNWSEPGSFDSTSFRILCVLRTNESEMFSILEQTAHCLLAEATEGPAQCFFREAQKGVIHPKAGPRTPLYAGI